MRIEQEVRIIVEDHGAGMPHDPSLFHDQAGEAFGLSSIKHRLEMLGGRLELQTAPGQGCRFTAVAPIHIANRPLGLPAMPGALRPPKPREEETNSPRPQP